MAWFPYYCIASELLITKLHETIMMCVCQHIVHILYCKMGTNCRYNGENLYPLL